MSRPSGGPPPLRSIQGNVFQNPPPANARANAYGGSGRLQNGKPGNNPGSWGFGLGGAGPTLQARSNTNSSTFSQAIGGTPSQTPLDLSEFPSLSGAPQSQQQNSSSQAAWGNSGTRAPPTAPGHRLVGNTQSASQAIQPPSQLNQAQQQRQSELQNNSHASPFSQIGNLDDFRFTQGRPSISSRNSDQQGAADDFPPLGGLGGVDLAAVRQNGSDQGSHANGAANGASFSTAHPGARNGPSGSFDPHQDSSSQANEPTLSPVDGNSRATPMSRSSLDQQEHEAALRSDQQSGGRMSRSSGQPGYLPSQIPFRPNQTREQPTQRYTPTDPQSTDSQSFQSNSRPVEHTGVGQMTELEKFGIPGLVELLRGGLGEDQTALALGMDLSTLGLDVHRPANQPLYVDWAGPFAEPGSRVPIPEFNLPQAYTVSNVPPLHTRIGSFSDDTLFMIFYQNPREEAQDMAAQELYKRDWRWHRKLQQWMMKAAEAPEPRVDPVHNEERGWYYFWDASTWRRERREFVLSYDHLHHPMSQQQAEEALVPR